MSTSTARLVSARDRIASRCVQSPAGCTLAVVGLGHVAAFHLAAIRAGSFFVPRWACDLDQAKACCAPGVPFTTNAERAILDEVVDAVVIATSPEAQFDLTRLALLAGKHVLLEKPATGDPAKLVELSNLARSQGIMLCVALHAAFALETLWLSGQLPVLEQAYGALGAFDSVFLDPYSRAGVPVAARASLGGSWMDSSINAISVLDRLGIGHLVLRKLLRQHHPALPDVDARAVASFRFRRHGRAGTGRIRTDWLLGVNSKRTVLRFGEATRVLLDHSNQRVILCRSGVRPKVLADFSGCGARLDNHYAGVFADFGTRLQSRIDNTGDALRVLEIATARTVTAPNVATEEVA